MKTSEMPAGKRDAAISKFLNDLDHITEDHGSRIIEQMDRDPDTVRRAVNLLNDRRWEKETSWEIAERQVDCCFGPDVAMRIFKKSLSSAQLQSANTVRLSRGDLAEAADSHVLLWGADISVQGMVKKYGYLFEKVLADLLLGQWATYTVAAGWQFIGRKIVPTSLCCTRGEQEGLIDGSWEVVPHAVDIALMLVVHHSERGSFPFSQGQFVRSCDHMSYAATAENICVGVQDDKIAFKSLQHSVSSSDLGLITRAIMR